MPANYSAIAENEMSYVVGGGLVDILADPMKTADWKQLNTNLINIIGNTYLSATVPAALGMVFSGSYVPGKVLEGAFKGVKGMWDYNNPNGDLKGGLTSYRWGGKEMLKSIPKPNFWRAPNDNDCGFNIGLQGVGVLSSIYTLGTAGKVGLEVKKFA